MDTKSAGRPGSCGHVAERPGYFFARLGSTLVRRAATKPRISRSSRLKRGVHRRLAAAHPAFSGMRSVPRRGSRCIARRIRVCTLPRVGRRVRPGLAARSGAQIVGNTFGTSATWRDSSWRSAFGGAELVGLNASSTIRRGRPGRPRCRAPGPGHGACRRPSTRSGRRTRLGWRLPGVTKPSISRSLRLKLGVHPRLAAADPVFSGVAARSITTPG